MPEPTVLDFQNKSLKFDTSDDVDEIVKFLENHDGITKIVLSGNSLGPGAAKILARHFSRHFTLKELILSDIFTGRLLSEIPLALNFLCNGVNQSKSLITELDLSDNAFGPAGIIALKPFFEDVSSNSLKVLKFNNNGMGIQGAKVLAEYLIACCKRCKDSGGTFALEEFYSGRNRIENFGAKPLSKAFKMIGTLKVISMPQNGIYHAGIKDLSDAFTANAFLKVINLNDNTATETGAAALSQALVGLKYLESLNLGDCLLGDKGACLIAKAFHYGSFNLKELILNNNNISTKGALQIIEDLKNVKLTTLNLNGNCFGPRGITLVKNLLKELIISNVSGSFSEDEGSPDEAEEEEEVLSEGSYEQKEEEEDEENSPYEHISAAGGDNDSDLQEGEENDEEDVSYASNGGNDDIVVVDELVHGLEDAIENSLNLGAVGTRNQINASPSNNQNSSIFSFIPSVFPTPTQCATNTFNTFPNFSFNINKKQSNIVHKNFIEQPTSDSFWPTTQTNREDNINVTSPEISFNFKTSLQNRQDSHHNITQDKDEIVYEYLIDIFENNPDALSHTEILMKFANFDRNHLYNAFSRYLKTRSLDPEKFGSFIASISANEKNPIENKNSVSMLKALFENHEMVDNIMITALLSHSGLIKNENRDTVHINPETKDIIRNNLKFFCDKPYINSFTRSIIEAFTNK